MKQPAPVPVIKTPDAGGSYVRDPVTGELTRVDESAIEQSPAAQEPAEPEHAETSASAKSARAPAAKE